MADLKQLGLVLDSKSSTIFEVESLSDPGMNVEQVLIANGVLKESNMQVDEEKIEAFVATLLHIQRDIFEEIGRSVDANLHKYLDISQTFSESKNMLGDSVSQVRQFSAYVEGQIERNSREFQAVFNRENR